jgi:hypothetical protein
MNQVISQKNINYLESLKDFLQKKLYRTSKMGKTGTIERFIWKKFEKWASLV